MAFYIYGELLRRRREEMKLTQEELAFGICSAATLSRIENGTQMPTRDHYEAFRERLGMPYDLIPLGINFESIMLVNIKDRIRDLLFQIRLNEIDIPFEELITLSQDITITNGDRQFIKMVDTIIHRDCMPAEERHQCYLDALHLTLPKINLIGAAKVITIDEAFCLMCVFACEFDLGNQERAIKHFKALEQYFCDSIFDQRSIFRIQHLITAMIARKSFLSGDIVQCILYCDKGIIQAKKYGFCGLLSELLRYRGKALLLRNQPGDQESAENNLAQADQLDNILGRKPDEI